MKRNRPKEETAEDYCFVCKDGGGLRICDYGDCLKAYHPQCVGKDESFLKMADCWTCSWHTCFICHSSSEYQCFCCPNSVCGACIRATEFVQLRKTKGFCSKCLKLLILAEENAEVDSDGGKLDFGDIETNEFLFKDYWDKIIKKQEKLSMEDVHEAENILKKGENYKDDYISGQILEHEGELTSDAEEMNKSYNEVTFPKDKVFRHRNKGSAKRFRFTKGDCTSWGSVELIEFLSFLGKDTAEPLEQRDVCEIIENYVYEKNLLHPNRRKKTVLCDDKLHSLFRKKTVKLIKVYNLLSDHFEVNVDSDDSEFGSERDAEPVIKKKLRRISSETERRNKGEEVHEQRKGYYASMIDKNIKLVYLKRSLLEDFLGTSETFQEKVVGCFVRVKSDPKDFDFSLNKPYLLRQVSGIKKVSEAYTVREMSTNIVLCVSNIWKDVCIPMLSDDDFEEEECEDLRQLVKKGLFRQPTVAELEEKVRSIHEDIMRHWIKREIAVLQMQIVRANLKGWNREKCEYIERRALLQTESEQVRLLKEIPEIIPDIQELEDMPNPQVDFQRENKCVKEIPEVIPDVQELEDMPNPQIDFQRECKSLNDIRQVILDVQELEVMPNPQIDFQIESRKSDTSEVAVEAKPQDKKSDLSEEAIEARAEGNKAASPEMATSDEEGCSKLTNMKKSCEEIAVIEIDDDDDNNDPPEALAKTSRVSCENLEKKPRAFGERECIWYYVDPSGREQGPFAMASLRYWKSEGFFDDAFRVWRMGQSRKDAILLKQALLLSNIEN